MTFVRHTFSGLVGALAPLAAALVTIPLYLSSFGGVRYGLFVLFLTALNYASFLDLGMGRALAYFMSRPDTGRAGHASVFWSAILLNVGVSGLIMLIGLAAAHSTIRIFPTVADVSAAEIARAMLWAFACLPLLSTLSLLSGAYQALQRFHRLNIIVAASGIALQCLPLIVCHFTGIGLEPALIAVFVVRLMTVALMLSFALRQVGPPPKQLPIVEMGRALTRYGGWISSVNILTSIETSGDRFLLSFLHGPAAVAAYSVPFDIATRLMIVGGTIANTIFPTLVKGSSFNDDTMKRVGKGILYLFTPVIIVAIFVLQPFLTLWVGPKIAHSARYVGEVVLAGVWITALTALGQSRLLAEGRGRLVNAVYLIQLPIYGAALSGAILLWGIVGCAAVWALRTAVDIVFLALSGDLRELRSSLLVNGALIVAAEVIAFIAPDFYWRILGLITIGGTSALISRAYILMVLQRLRIG